MLTLNNWSDKLSQSSLLRHWNQILVGQWNLFECPLTCHAPTLVGFIITVFWSCSSTGSGSTVPPPASRRRWHCTCLSDSITSGCSGETFSTWTKRTEQEEPMKCSTVDILCTLPVQPFLQLYKSRNGIEVARGRVCLLPTCEQRASACSSCPPRMRPVTACFSTQPSRAWARGRSISSTLCTAMEKKLSTHSNTQNS